MQIVTDSGADILLSPEDFAKIDASIVPLVVTLDGKSYRENIDIKPEGFYKLLEHAKGLPITSQPSAGDFADTYKRIAEKDPEILSIHMSSGLSGTFNSAQAGAKLTPEANVTHVDTKTLSVPAGWQVEAAVRARNAGWPLDKILTTLKRIGDATDCGYTLKELKYLISGGRISHMKGLIASILNLKPIIGVEKENGTYVQLGQARTFKKALQSLANTIAKKHELGSRIRVQIMHSFNPEGAEMLHDIIDKMFKCDWMPSGTMSLVLGAHTGPSMVGVVYAPSEVFDELPPL